MKKSLFNKWLKALESGNYKKGDGELYDLSEDAYCCLGVLERVAGASRDDLAGRAFVKCDGDDNPTQPQRGLSEKRQIKLSYINDGAESFAPVIQYLKRNRSRIVKD